MSELRTEAGRCRDLAVRKNQKVAEKEREARRMREEAVRVGNHADKLKRDRARSLQQIESKLVFVLTDHFSITTSSLGKQLHIHGCKHDISESSQTFSVSAIARCWSSSIPPRVSIV